jgi:CHASE2 domain-containing sensor protein
VLPFFLRLGGAAITFVLLSWLRLWFDLARAQVVVRDQGAVRRALAATFRQPFRHPLRLLGAYVFIGLLGLGCLLAGIGVWHALVPPASVAGAFLVGQGTLFLGMACRFWQRALAVRHLDAVREASAPDC